MTFDFQKHCTVFSQLFGSFLAMMLLSSCAKNGGFAPLDSATGATSLGNSSQSATSPVASPAPSSSASAPSPVAYQSEPLSWESSAHPERAQWSSSLETMIAANFATLSRATDLSKFCPNAVSLNQNQIINLWADIFASDSYYESGWNPAEYSVDVGTASDNSTWSVGLMQMSVVDQANYKLTYGFSFTDLQGATDNLQLAVAVMTKQIANHGTILIPTGGSGLYWSTLHPGGAYDKSAGIIAMTEKLSFCH